MKCVRAFSECEVGEIEVERWASRSGRLARLHRLGVGDGEGNLTFRRLSADESPRGRAEAAIVRFLKGADGACSLRAIEGGVTGTAADTRERVRALAEDEARPVRAVDSGGHARYTYAAELDSEPQPGAEF